MAIIGTLESGIGKRTQVVSVAQAGPNPYATGGFTIVTGLATIDYFNVTPDDASLLAASDTGYAIVQTKSGGTITVKVWAFNAGAWGEASTGNLSGITFNVLAVGY